MPADLRFTISDLRLAGAHCVLCVLWALSGFSVWADDAGFGPPISVPRDLPQTAHRLPARNLIDQTREEAARKSAGCLECHKGIEDPSMHASPNVVLGCTDCHGGNPTPGLTQRKAHVQPLQSGILAKLGESQRCGRVAQSRIAEFIQFVNPGDLRVADKACGLCHKRGHAARLATA